MKNMILILTTLIVSIGCEKKEYHVVEVDNPTYSENTAFKHSEDLSSPKFRRLKEKYQLDTIFQGEEDEFTRILLLREWIKSVIEIEDHGDPYPGGGYVEGILDAALDGTGFHCGHFMKVQNGVMNAYGYVTRTIGAGPGVKDVADGHHGINEIWSNTYHKWFLSDAKYNHHFEKGGIPLSALEVRDEYLKNKAVDISMVKGKDRIDTKFDEVLKRDKASFARTYTWIEYHTNNNMFTVWPKHKESLTMYADDYFKNNTWMWGGKPHWAYDKPEFMILEAKRGAIEWTPNTISSNVKIEDHIAHIKLISDAPNLKEYQMKKMLSEGWQKVESRLEVELSDDVHEIIFRTVNLADVFGPAHRIKIQSK
ncbi:MAG: hypothetical protein QM485_07560 [Flavobacteriaceae bacterium]